MSTKGAENIICWFLIAPPKDVRKLELARGWIDQRPRDVERVRKQLEDDGLLQKK